MWDEDGFGGGDGDHHHHHHRDVRPKIYYDLMTKIQSNRSEKTVGKETLLLKVKVRQVRGSGSPSIVIIVGREHEISPSSLEGSFLPSLVWKLSQSFYVARHEKMVNHSCSHSGWGVETLGIWLLSLSRAYSHCDHHSDHLTFMI